MAEPERSDSPEVQPPPEVTHAMIERRAFELWLVRGGTPEENWLEAERELRREYGRDGR